jgi:HK97 family phage major capsid protein
MSPYDACQHGYIPSSCAECRRGTEAVSYVPTPKTAAEIASRTVEIKAELKRMESDPVVGEDTHGQLRDKLLAELDALMLEEQVLTRNELAAARRAEIERITRVAQDPRNLEASVPAMRPDGTPALVRQLGTRLETPEETIQRAGNPWRDESGPLNRETAAGFVSRAHSAVEAVSERLGHDGAELLATLLSERRDLPGVSVRRSQDEIRQGAEMIISLSSPYYESAVRHWLRNPDLFRTGMGAMVWSDEERESVHAVMNNELVRAAFAESSGAVGAFALPLQLSPEILFTNAGIASPHRNLARHELGTSNTWNGVTSAGATANFISEATAVTDTTPSIGQLVITPYKIMTWIFGSFEVLDDTNLAEQVPRLFDEARSRLEGTVFATGTGTPPNPFGVVTRSAADATAGNPTAALIYAMDQNLPPRFRNGGKVAWAANETVRNICRQIPAFTGAVTSIVNDNGNVPTMLGYPFYESSAMLSGTVGNRELLLGDWSSYIIVDRLPSVVLAEPLVMSQATALPTGQRGWLNYSRVGADTVTQGAALGSNAFVCHVH